MPIYKNPLVVVKDRIKFCEYIEATGTQYISTFCYRRNQSTATTTRVTTKIEIDYYTTNSAGGGATNAYLFGEEYATNDRFSVGYDATGLYYYSTTAGKKYLNGATSGTNHIIVDFANNKIMVNSVENVLQGYTNKAGTNEIRIFTFNYGVNHSPGQYGHFKLFGFRIFENYILTNNFVPAYISETDIGVYDTVFQLYHKNSGTGEFIKGPDVNIL